MTGLLTLGALGVSLSVDAFAAAVGKGATNDRNRWSDALRVGAVFGFFEAITPAVGWAAGLALSTWIAAVDHWIAFFLLLGVGGHMVNAALHAAEGGDTKPKGNASLLRLVATALATSIDATAVGVSLAVMQVNILTACLVIGAITTVVATLGVRLGRHAGDHIGRYAELLGGAALIVIGASILFQHLTAWEVGRMAEPTTRRTGTLALAAGSIGVSLVVPGLKYIAFALTGSVALYSHAIESIINVVTAIAAFFAVRVSLRPADPSHPYGHSKAEYFSAVLEGVLILVASLAILREAYGAFIDPHPIKAPVLGLGISSIATILNAGWSWLLIRTGRSRRSPALVADGKHLLTDVYTSGGVVVGVVLVALTGWERLDPAIAGLVALNILWAGWGIIKESLGGLMDTALPEKELAAVKKAIDANMAGALEAHDLRSRHAGRMTFIDFHLVVDGAMTVEASHAICDRIEAALKADRPDSIISIYVEPASKRKHGDMEIAWAMHFPGFLALAVVGLTPAVLAGWLDPKSRRRRDRARRERSTAEPSDRVGRRSRLSGTDPGVWHDKPAANTVRREQQDENASI